MEIGFIGLGNMGAPMAKNLAAAGHTVTGFDVTPVTVEGVTMAASAIGAAQNRDAVITMLPNGAILTSVYAEIVPAGKPGATFIDCSTVDVDSAKAAAEKAATAGLLPVDAPVSGGMGGAVAGTLTFMAGGSPEAYALAEPLFSIMGQKSVLCGPSGSGQAVKICNNMILGISMIGVCEGFNLAEQLGLDAQAMFDVVSTSSGNCWSLNTYCPVPGVGPQSPADNGWKPGFAAELMLKDLGLSQDAAKSVAATTPLGQHATELFKQFNAEGGQGQDFSAIINWLRDR